MSILFYKCGRLPSELIACVNENDATKSYWLCGCGNGFVPYEGEWKQSHDISRAVHRAVTEAIAGIDIDMLTRDILERIK